LFWYCNATQNVSAAPLPGVKYTTCMQGEEHTRSFILSDPKQQS
jgi:hypothetical protein